MGPQTAPWVARGGEGVAFLAYLKGRAQRIAHDFFLSMGFGYLEK